MRASFGLALLLLVAPGCGEDRTSAENAGAATSPPSAEAPGLEADPELEIDRVGISRYVIDADALAALGVAAGAGDLELAQEERGVRLTAVATDSAPAQLGLASGDLIRGINGVEMVGRKALEQAWARIQSEDKAKLSLERDGAAIELTWILRRSVESPLDASRRSRVAQLRSAAHDAVVELAVTGLEEIEPGSYRVDRAILEAIRDHPELADRSLAGLWSSDGGVRVVEGSIFAALDIGRYDVVRGVDAETLTSPSDLQAALAYRAEEARELAVALVRAGQPEVLRYQVIDEGPIDRAAWKQALEAFAAVRREKRDAAGRGAAAGLRPPIAGIRKVDETTYEVSEAAIAEIVADPARFARGARVLPSIADGKPNGFKLYAVRPDSLFAQLGLASGDTIHAVNGLSLSPPDAALELVERLRGARQIEISVTRRGEPVRLTFRRTE